MPFSGLLAALSVLLGWRLRHVGAAASVAVTSVGVLMAAWYGLDLENVGNALGALAVLIIFLSSVSSVLLTDRAHGHRATHGLRAIRFLLGVCWCVLGVAFATANFIGSGDTRLLTSVLDIFLIEGSARQTLDTEYDKLLEEYGRQVESIEHLRRSLWHHCRELDPALRHRGLGMKKTRRMLKEYLAIHSEATWEEPTTLSRLCKFFSSPSISHHS